MIYVCEISAMNEVTVPFELPPCYVQVVQAAAAASQALDKTLRSWSSHKASDRSYRTEFDRIKNKKEDLDLKVRLCMETRCMLQGTKDAMELRDIQLRVANAIYNIETCPSTPNDADIAELKKWRQRSNNFFNKNVNDILRSVGK
jgi:hypothetical protein